MKKTDSTRGIGLLVSAGGVSAMLHFKHRLNGVDLRCRRTLSAPINGYSYKKVIEMERKHKNEESGKWYGKSDYSAGEVG